LTCDHRIENHVGHADQFHAHGFEVEFSADRIIHPAIGDQNPQRRQAGAERDQKGHHQMLYA